MKTNKKFFTAAVFFTGLVLGISIMGLLAFTSAPSTPAPGPAINPVSSTDANLYFKNYLAGAATFNQVIKGFTIDKTQLNAMNIIAAENSTLTGFRIYMGKDNKSLNIAIIVGINSNGKDAVTNTIYKTDAPGNPCPPVCDATSPIVQN